MKQTVYYKLHSLPKIFKQIGAKNVFLVCGRKSITENLINSIKNMGVVVEIFQNFTPNPKYEEAESARLLFSNGNFQAILAIGGGSALDVAKYLTQFTNAPLITIPTTAGSGSESTSFVVLYKDGKKMSLSLQLPKYVILEPDFLRTLPIFQRKCTLLDALCQAIEAYWSINSTKRSKMYSKEAIKLILNNYKQYLELDQSVNAHIMTASNKAGQAINIAKTTAAHAMSYKITSLLGLPHGHAVSICMCEVWSFLENNLTLCIDPRGKNYLGKTLQKISQLLSLKNFNNILQEMNIQSPKNIKKDKLDEFVNSVNLERLKNFPVLISKESLLNMYENILCKV